MALSEIAHVVVDPPENLKTDLIRQVAEIVSKDPYSIRLLLAGKIPRIIAHYSSMEEPQKTAGLLKSLGLMVMVARESEIRKPIQSFCANTMAVEGQHIRFQDRNGSQKEINQEDVFLILKGMTQTRLEKETTTTSRKLNLSATVLTGGIPVWRKVKQTAKDTHIKNEGFIRLYDRTYADPCVEILQSDFNYACLGTQLALSSLVNLNAVAVIIRETFPQAIWDERLVDFYQADIPTASAEESTDINCKLISLYYQSRDGHD